jgi:hypothetical protein
MAGVLKPLGTALTRLPMGPGNPGRTAGAAFQMYYQMGNLRTVAKCRLGAAVRTGDRTIPAVCGMRSAGRGS